MPGLARSSSGADRQKYDAAVAVALPWPLSALALSPCFVTIPVRRAGPDLGFGGRVDRAVVRQGRSPEDWRRCH